MSSSYQLPRAALRLSLFGLILGWTTLAHAGVEIFTVAGQPVTNVPDDSVVIELDAPARLDAQLSTNLPANRDQARREVQRRFHSPEWDDVMSQYRHAATGVARAWMIGVEKIPAVVVDSRYVVYGQPDVAAALREIEEGR